MNYHNITKDDMLNGEGLRTVLWVSGCSHHCKNCHNPITWDPEEGLLFDAAAKEELLEALSKPYISGLTLSGGDPLFCSNRDVIGSLAAEVKNRYPDKTIWLYTGYRWEEIKDLPLLSSIDVLIDGQFEEEQKENKLHWRGSKNQRIIDVKASLASDQPVLYQKAYTDPITGTSEIETASEKPDISSGLEKKREGIQLIRLYPGKKKGKTYAH